jgi:allantoate deiminase
VTAGPAAGHIATDLAEVSRFGGEGTGLTRLAWTPELRGAYDWVGERLEELGLRVEVDAAGNLLGKWEAGSGRAVVVGSHLDSVPRGGRFDGTLGVLSGLDAVRRLRRAGVEPRRPLWVAAWMDEEGSRFDAALMGSRAFAGEDVTPLAGRRDAAGTTLREAMAAWDRDADRAGEARAIDRVGAYLELHIEQGPVLERSGTDIGVVTAIVGLLGLRARFLGQANHAGTTPMEARRDALAGAARAVLWLRDMARAGAGITANVGRIAVQPGAFNAIPGACEISVDVRADTAERMALLEPAVHGILSEAARAEDLELEVRETYRLAPVPLDAGLADVLDRAAAAEGATSVRMPSGAGHDAMVLAPHVPAAMLFVPSRGGVSHSPAELTTDGHCELGARVLAAALRELLEAD